MRAANDQNLLRSAIENEIERLIRLLDLLDGDCDLEDGADAEPSIESTPRIFGDRAEHDLELDSSDDEWSGDEHEPTLGWGNPRCGTPDIAKGWHPSDASDEKLNVTEPDLVPDQEAADIARRLLRQVVKDHRKLATAISNTRLAVDGGIR